jgi:hypothetical protein
MNVENGMAKDALGRLVPLEMVKAADRQRDDLVNDLFGAFTRLQQGCESFRERADAEIDAHLQLVQEKYGVKIRGQSGNLVLTSYDGELRICRAVDKVVAFTDEIHAAKTLIFECVEEWTAEARPELKVVADDAFRQDKQGHLSVDRILGLLRWNINDSVAFSVAGANLTNEIGLTEGNPRAGQFISGDAGARYYLARPVLGQSWRAAVTMRF